MASHVTHLVVHDHGLNNVSTYGALLRLFREGRITPGDYETGLYEMALKSSGAVQVRRWSPTAEGGGYIFSFNGPQSRFVDTIRTLRAPALACRHGHHRMAEGEDKI